jgi:hypothetical protein
MGRGSSATPELPPAANTEEIEEDPMQLPEQITVPNRRPILIRGAVVGVALITLFAVFAARRPKTPDELDTELVTRLARLSNAVMTHDERRIAPLLDDAFTDEDGRDKQHALAVLTDDRRIPAIGFRPDREVYTLSPDGHTATVKNTVRIFGNAPKTHRVVAADVTIITDWVLTGSGWLLHHTHHPITRAVRLWLPGQKVKT